MISTYDLGGRDRNMDFGMMAGAPRGHSGRQSGDPDFLFVSTERFYNLHLPRAPMMVTKMNRH